MNVRMNERKSNGWICINAFVFQVHSFDNFAILYNDGKDCSIYVGFS